MPFIPLNKNSFVSVFVCKGIYYKGGAVPQQIYCFITKWKSGWVGGLGWWVQVKMGIQFGDKGQTGGERVENKEMAGKYLAHEGEKQTQ